jgi:Domain of unknown function (DUF4279)
MHEYTVEFRIYGKDLIPSDVTKDLGLIPSLIQETHNKVGTKRIKESLWAFNGYKDDEAKIWESLDEGLNFVLKKLIPFKSKIAKYKSKGDLVLWCGHFQSDFDGGPTLSPEVLNLLSEFGVKLFIDNYFSE